MSISKLKRALLFTSASLLLTACVSKTANQDNYSGFLKDYSQLEKVKLADGATAMRWISPELKPGTYSKIFIDPVIVYPEPKNTSTVDAKLIKDAAAYLETRIAAELTKSGIEVTTDPAATGALRLAAAITTVETVSEGVQAYEILPIAAVLGGISVATGARDRVVTAYLEAEISDLQTGAVLSRTVKKGVSDKTIENDKTKVGMDLLKPTLDNWVSHGVTIISPLLHP